MADHDTRIADLRAQALALYRANAENPITIDGEASAQLARLIGLAVLQAGIVFMQARLEGRTLTTTPTATPAPQPLQVTGDEPEVMTADEVAAFLGVDRNTVYDYAGRG